MSQLIAIKLGSSNTSIFKQGEGLVLFEPTLVAVSGEQKNPTVIAIGSVAEKMQGRTDKTIKVVSPVKEGRISDPELAVVMLKEFISKVIPGTFIKPKIKAIVCTPLGVTLKEKQQIDWVCRHAGIQDSVFVPSVMAGAIGYNLAVDAPYGMCLVNIGGGSTDIASISANTVVSGVNIGIGGKLMDEAIEQAVLNVHQLKIGEGIAKKLKEEIGSLYPNDISSAEVNGVDSETGEIRSVVVESKLVYDAIVGIYEKIAEAIQAEILSSPANVIEDIQNQGIYLMGGASLITGAEQFFRRKLNLPVIIQDHTTAIDVLGAGKLLTEPKLLKVLSSL